MAVIQKELSQETIDVLVKSIVETAHPLRILLFGSAARGTMNQDSDLDVLVVMPEGTNRLRIAGDIYMNLDIEYPVDIVVATEGDLEEYAEDFSRVYYPAIKEGITIYAA